MSTTESEREARIQQTRLQVERLFPQVNNLSYRQFVELTDNKSEDAPLLIDVRETEEHDTGTLEGGRLVRDVRKELSETPQVKNIVCFCTVGLRSAIEAQRLMDDGHTVFNYCIMTHLDNGGVLVKPDGQPWDQCVHSYSQSHAGLFDDRYTVKWFGGITAAVRAMRSAPGVLSALGKRVIWRSNPNTE